jgi:hypothetical protein
VPEPEADHARRVVGYYHQPESRLSYRLLRRDRPAAPITAIS